MGIFEEVSAQMTRALREKAAARLAALRNIRAAFLTEIKKDNKESLDDETCVGLLRRLEKQRRESIEAYEAGGRPERAEAEQAELAVVQEFLPSLADEATTARWVDEAIAESGASEPGDLGRVMGTLMKAHRGGVDGALARRLAGERLTG
jgi:uncharacterized protein YqeY